MPNGFPYHGRPREERPNTNRFISKKVAKRLDSFGAALLLLATLFLVAALEEADVDYPWKSSFVITLLTISGLSWIGFLLWSWHTTLRAGVREPIFPWRFVQNRVLIGMLL